MAVFAAALWNRRPGINGSNVSSAAPKKRLNVIPMRFVHIQLMLVLPIRVVGGISAVTDIFASKLNTPLVLIAVPLCSFLRSDG
jgi:hypothetical protein